MDRVDISKRLEQKINFKNPHRWPFWIFWTAIRISYREKFAYLTYKKWVGE